MFCQITTNEKPISFSLDIELSSIPIFKSAILNLEQLKVEDEIDAKNNIPPRFGYPVPITFNRNNLGKFSELNNGDRIWRLRIICPNATSIGFNFTKFNIETGVKIWIYNFDKSSVKGAFTSLNNKGSIDNIKGFAISPIYGEDVIIEIYEPKQTIGKSIIELNQIIYGYRFIKSLIPTNSLKTQLFGDAGACQVNVNCIPEGNAWQDEKRGVAMILIANQRACTGSLVNNTANNQDLLFLTAHHCISPLDANSNTDASNWTFWWDYEGEIQPTGNTGCINPNSDPTHRETSGAILLANNSESDFALFRLTENPMTASPPINVFFNGWSRTSNPIAGGAGIHHPAGDIKKKSTHNQIPLIQATGGTYPSNSAPNSFFEVLWINTTNGFSVTEGGSSGSPLFMDNGSLPTGLIIGQLWGGSADNCNSPSTDEGVYGKLGISWNFGASPIRRLKDWLDPLNLDVESLNGGYPDFCLANVTMYKTINTMVRYQAAKTLISTSKINASAKVDIRAGDSILLKPGFHAKNNSNTHFHITNCISNVIPLSKKNYSQNIEANKNISKLYPNPSSSNITIEFYNPKQEFVLAELYNIQGKKVYSHLIENKDEYVSFNLELNEFASGSYFLKLIHSNGYENLKLLIEPK